MKLAEAIRLLKTRDCSMHEHAAAGAFLHSFYSTEGRHLTKPVTFTTDAFRQTAGKTYDTKKRPMSWRDELQQAVRGLGATEMGSDPESRTGPVEVARLNYPASQCSLIAGEGGNAVVLFHGTPDDQLEPGEGLGITKDRAVINRRVRLEQRANRRFADSVQAFWKGQKGHA
jgi:hypothetical protein